MFGEGQYNWFLFESAEDNIVLISDYVDIRSKNVYSRQMALKLYEVGTLVEGMMKKIIDDQALNSFPNLATPLEIARRTIGPHPDIRAYRNVLEPVFTTSKRSISFQLFNFSTTFFPFSSFGNTKDTSPGWWQAYNSVKHDFFGKLHEATFERLIEGAGALFLLTVLYHANWPYLIHTNRLELAPPKNALVINRLRVEDPRILRTLLHFVYQALMPHTLAKSSRPVGVVSTMTQNVLARSRLFSIHLARFNRSSRRFEIPQDENDCGSES